MAGEERFYGRGAAHPWTLGPGGGISERAGVGAIEDSIRVLLGTGHGERVMRPDFGCNLRALQFAPRNEETANLARHYVSEGLARWEPRIEVMDVGVEVEKEPGSLVIDVIYRVLATQEVGTLVYPFYLGGA